MKNSFNKKITLNGEKIFLFAYTVYLIYYSLKSSTFNAIINMDSTQIKILVRVFVYGLILYKIIGFDNYSKKIMLLYGTLLLIGVLVAILSEHETFLDIIVITLGTTHISYEKIIRRFFYTEIILTVLLFFLSVSNVIENYMLYKSGIPRYSFGDIYPTSFATKIFYLELCFAYLHKRFNILNLVFFTACGVFVYYLCYARLNTILIILFAVVMWIYSNFSVDKILKIKALSFVLQYGVLIFCVISVIFTLLYDSNSTFWRGLDSVFSSRLQLGKKGFTDYGVSLFGKNILMTGWGYTGKPYDWSKGYFFIDNGYLNMLLQFGILFFVICLLGYTLTLKKAIKNKDYVLAIVVFFIAISNVVESHFIEIRVNPFIFFIPYLMGNINATFSHASNKRDKIIYAKT